MLTESFRAFEEEDFFLLSFTFSRTCEKRTQQQSIRTKILINCLLFFLHSFIPAELFAGKRRHIEWEMMSTTMQSMLTYFSIIKHRIIHSSKEWKCSMSTFVSLFLSSCSLSLIIVNYTRMTYYMQTCKHTHLLTSYRTALIPFYCSPRIRLLHVLMLAFGWQNILRICCHIRIKWQLQTKKRVFKHFIRDKGLECFYMEKVFRSCLACVHRQPQA